jgi:hypothetical protein
MANIIVRLSWIFCADGGSRTHILVRELRPERSASASFATSAEVKRIVAKKYALSISEFSSYAYILGKHQHVIIRAAIGLLEIAMR